MAERLHLQAHDQGDVEIISALVQDAACKRARMTYQPKQRRFVVMMNRFRWEREVKKRGLFRRRIAERVASALRFDFVDAVKMQGLNGQDPEQVFALLSINAQAKEGEVALLDLVFAGGATIRLEAECVDVTLEDLSAPWPAKRRPAHEAG